jgi:hypothetical protein
MGGARRCRRSVGGLPAPRDGAAAHAWRVFLSFAGPDGRHSACVLAVVRATAGIQRVHLPSFRRKPESILLRRFRHSGEALPWSSRGRPGSGFCCWAFAITTYVPVWSGPPSWRPRYFLLLVQEKVTKENTPSDPRPRRWRGCATGGRVRLARHPWRVSRIGAIPRAARVRCTRLVRPPFAAAQRDPGARAERWLRWLKIALTPALSRKRERGKGGVPSCGGGVSCSALASAAGTAALCSSRAPLGRGEQAEEKPEGARAGMRARSTRAQDVLPANPAACSRSHRAWMPGDRGREGVFLLVTSLWTSKEK